MLSAKLEIIKSVRKGEGAVNIAAICGVGRRTVNDKKKTSRQNRVVF